MSDLVKLTQRIEAAAAAGRWSDAADLRRQLIEVHPDTTEAHEAQFKLGLDALFRLKDLDTAAEHLRAAARSKDTEWSTPARVSLGLVMLRAGKPQQAMFELRKVAGREPPTLETIQATAFLIEAHREAGQGDEVERARAQLQRRLRSLISTSTDRAEIAYARYMLGMELKHDGRRADARTELEAAQSTGALPEAETRSLEAALDDL